ncbi:putative glucose transporter/membrane transporter D2 [Leptomonas pyrrhocoris]|uniref:Putative glucose transporter/membrane transporter D2 n=1 Tax=Leptomonas pyrrhocoris TaxID=157538 RepID=A0A0M9FVJ2_LEPPY|nr:putative glucose transporter/membrane transporter D2 [Leptomonas pyrrhocoris]XP_015655258.1 putative glucose transporter/membrane transporter D2 [Leptomonas pyrrhocoris]XP_015655260.1 putative glucose transporter/membrane transporter D2 [Leptomonas pyrrhocoris]XP_015655262.1 putative glucose transporter/membrane transporter D2 [Leptomonas pyrrhocoris]XP_015655264.1 putative glucose transporter/membrane transporter D2 [Leptomonas pyrrhocoris]XP_015655266.1 putative glucose transporter/membra|eukprot:XP_015655256.1 putative glucose transporter/membrane transporter D2 [Leptomonas pyrrhocoris]
MSRESMSGDVALEAKQVPAGEPFIAFPAGEMGPIDEIGDSANVTETAKEPTSFFCWQNFLVVLPSLLTATLFGYNIGYVGPYTRIYSYATNCQLYGAQTSCETLSGAKCKWMDATTVNATSTLGMVCGWEAPRTTCFLSYDDEGSCGADHDCVWSYSASTCGNKVGYTSIQSGLFAGSMMMGGICGALLGGYLTKWLDYRKSFLLIGVIASVGSILTHVATGISQYWLMFVSRIIFGFPMGWTTVTGPHYTDKFAVRRYQKTLGTLFQVSTTVGSLIAAVLGICLGNTIAYDAERDAKVMGRLQGLTALSTLMCILTLFMPLVTKDGYSVSNAKYTAPEDDATAAKPAAKKYPISKMVGPLLIGVAMGCTLHLTGIGANMNFAPMIMSNLGLDPLVGNIIVMVWNCVTAFGAIPLSKKFTMRTLFLSCAAMGSLCCLFLSGIPVYPGVTKSTLAKEVIGIIGIALFILAYDCGIAPCFFVLTVDVFPESFRPIGSSFTMGVMFSLNLVINICYPIATEGISGGPSGNQDKGQAVAFIFFGCIGIVTVVIEYFFLHPWEDPVDSVPSEE